MSSSSKLLPLPYALVGKRGDTAVVLAEFAFDVNGPFPALARELLQDPGYRATAIETYSMITLERDGLCFIIAVKNYEVNERLAREALQDISSSFAARIGLARARAATRRYAFNVEFAPILQRLLEKCAHVEEMDEELVGLNAHLERTKKRAQHNIHALVDRGNKLDTASRTSEQLGQTGSKFQSAARELRRMECWQTWRGKLVLFSAALLALVIFLVWMFKS